MISLVDITEFFDANNVYLLKIKSNSLCYKNQSFCKTVKQEINGKTTAFINVLNDSATVFCFDTADIEEIDMFLSFSCIQNVFCNECFANNSQKYAFNKSVLLKLNPDETGEKIYEKTFNPDYKSIYKLIADDFLLPDYNEFVSDLSFRLNHSSSRIIQTQSGVVFTGWEDKNNAIISAISVYITDRNKGEGSRLLKSMIFDLKQSKKDNIYVYCEDKTVAFYLKNRFEFCEHIFIGKVK